MKLRTISRFVAQALGSAIAVAMTASACTSAEVAELSAESTATTAAPTTVVVTTSTTEPPTTSTEPPIPEVPTERPGSVAELADALTEAEVAVRNETNAQARALWGERQQWLYQLLEIEPAPDAVLSITASGLAGDAVALNFEARQALTNLVNNYVISDNLPAWSIEAPLPPDELLQLYMAAEAETAIDWEYLAAINLVETRMGRINGVSTAGAIGPMQFLPTTWAECCEGDPKIPADAILGAGQYLVDRGGPEDMDRAILGYNNSKNYVAAVKAYAEVLRQDPDAYYGYHAWQVYFRSTAGLARLPVGYYETESIDAAAWFKANPEGLIN